MARMIDADRLPVKSWKKTAVAFQDDYTAGAGTDWTLQVATAENRMLWEIIGAIENAPTLTTPNEWISVEERLPEPTYCVLVYTTDYSIEVDALDSDGEWMSYEVTHWMPLPKSPKEDE